MAHAQHLVGHSIGSNPRLCSVFRVRVLVKQHDKYTYDKYESTKIMMIVGGQTIDGRGRQQIGGAEGNKKESRVPKDPVSGYLTPLSRDGDVAVPVAERGSRA